MSVLGGSDSAVKQNTQNAPVSASDQGVALALRGSSNLGDKNSGNITIQKGGTYAPVITYTSDSGLKEEFNAWRADVNAALNKPPPGIADALIDRKETQITDAPEEAKKEKRNMLIIVVSILAVAALALFFGRKK